MKSRPFTDFPRNEQGLVDNYIGTAYDVVKNVSDNMPELERLDGVLTEIETLATLTANTAVAQAMVPAVATMDAKIDEAEAQVVLATNQVALAGDQVDLALAASTSASESAQSAASTAAQSVSILEQSLAAVDGGTKIGMKLRSGENGNAQSAIKEINDYLARDVVSMVNTIADLRALKKSVALFVITAGYYTNGDGGGGEYVCDVTDSTSVDDGGSVIVADDGGRWKLIVHSEVSIRQFGATGVDQDFQDAAINAFITYLIKSQKWGFVPRGSYRHSGRVVMDMVNAPGVGAIKLRGEGAYASMLVSSATTGTSFLVTKTGPVNSDAQRVHTYGVFENIGFLSDTTNATFVLGGADLIDCGGNYSFKNVFFSNVNSTKANTVSLQLNYVFDCTFENIVAVGNVSYGDALNCRQAHFNTFTGGSFSNAANGVVFNGFSHNNTFISADMENVGVGVLNVTEFDQNNIFVNPFFDIHNPVTGTSNGFAVRSLNAGSGGLILDSPYTQQRTGNYLVDPANQVGLFIRGTTREQVVTPAFPASDIAVTNNTGRTILVRFVNGAGTLTAIFINGEQTQFTGGSIVVLPRQTIAPRYTGTAPTWYWNTMV